MSNMVKYRRRTRAWQRRHVALAPEVRDVAPDLELRRVKGKKPVRFSNFQGR